jgi:EmrB/QacA subfamily drug resistance transporter
MTESAGLRMRSRHNESERRRWLALVVLCTGQLMIILDQTIVNVALPSIQDDLDFSQSGLAWVVNVYLIAFGGLLLLAGRLGDLLGRRRILVVGLLVFTGASLLCGAADSKEVLVTARAVQGVGGAMASSVVLGIIFTTVPEQRELAKAIGFFSFVAAAGGALGPLAGGVLTQTVSWHWIFFVNVPLGIAATVLAVCVLEPERGIGFGRGADLPGAFLVTAGLTLAVYTILGGTSHGWGSAHTVGFGAVTLVLLAGFVARQASATTPILPLRVFRSRYLSGANLVQALMVAGMFGFLFLGTLYVQRVLGYDAMMTGLAFLPTPAAIAAISLFLSARLNTSFGERAMVVAGLVLIVAGLALLGRAPVGATISWTFCP